MLNAYLDETGHSRDEAQKFVGMAGLVAPVMNWEFFDPAWRAALKSFSIQHFHMREFAFSKGPFKGWQENQRQELFGTLLRVINESGAMPIGSILRLDVFRSLLEECRTYVPDPYYICMVSCLSLIEGFAVHTDADTVAIVLSEQVEFKRNALRLFDQIRRDFQIPQRALPPAFRDMRDVVQLQAADLVAYEMQKEYERRLYRLDSKPRYGYLELLKPWTEKGFEGVPFIFQTKDDLARCIPRAEERDEK